MRGQFFEFLDNVGVLCRMLRTCADVREAEPEQQFAGIAHVVGWQSPSKRNSSERAGAALVLQVGRGDPQAVMVGERLKVGAGAAGILFLGRGAQVCPDKGGVGFRFVLQGSIVSGSL